MINKLLFIIFLLFVTLTRAQNGEPKILVSENDVRLNWPAASGDILSYDVERKSAQLNVWKTLFRIPADNRLRIDIYDKDLSSERYYYRIKYNYKNGSRYSAIREADLTRPGMFRLNQNYPNPFNPATSIKYSIPEAGYVDLKIYNLLGQEVKTLVAGYQEAGEHTVYFDAEELNSGLYIYKLISGNEVLTRKMTLLK